MKNNAIKKITAITVITGLINLVLSLLFVVRLPAEVPTHFDFSFVCDGVGSKWSGIILPIVLCLIFPFGLLITSKSKNIEKNTKPLTIILLFIEVLLIAVNWFLLVLMNSGAKPGDKIEGRFILLLPLLFGFTFIIIGNYMPTVRQNKNLGIKLPWTLNNEHCWDKTHRFAGRIWVIIGLLMLIAAVITACTGAVSGAVFLAVTFIPITIAAIVPMIYAYMHRNDR